jgi:hypothetical protein
LPRAFKQTVDTTEATTQADLFDPNKQGAPLGGGKPEPTACKTAPSYGRTVWYDFAPPTPGGVRISTTGFDNVFAVYEWNLKTAELVKLIACQNSSTGSAEERLIERPLRAGHHYTIQVGGVNGAGGLLDFSFEFFPDRDGDEIFDEAPDECPRLPGIATFGGCPPLVHGLSRLSIAGTGHGVRVTALTIARADKGARIEVRCGRCGHRVRVRARKGGRVRVRAFENRVVGAGDRIELRITHPRERRGRFRFGAIGKVIRWRVTDSGVGAPTMRCTRPGSAKRIRCP